MYVSPISVGNYQRNNNQSFKARVPKNLLKQMQGKTEPLKELTHVTEKGLSYTLTATTMATIFSTTSNKDQIDSKMEKAYKTDELLPVEKLEKLPIEEFIEVAAIQNKDGDTIFHKENTDSLVEKLEEHGDSNLNARILRIENNDNQTAYEKNPTQALSDLIVKTATSGDLCLTESENLVKVNNKKIMIRTSLNLQLF